MPDPPPTPKQPPSAASQPTPSIAGYDILRPLGQGGMGVVYLARHTRLNRLVALKLIRPDGGLGEDERARLKVEAEAAARLAHPGIVQIYELGDHDGTPYLALEHCPGGSLTDHLAGKPLPPAQAASLVEQVARAVHEAHEKGVVHRDLKPSNVLLDAAGRPKVADFGLAKLLDSEARLTATEAILGTPSYMAPEQVGRAATVGPAADIWALGAILYECLAAAPPFCGASGFETMMQVKMSDPPPLVGLPRDLATACLKCLEKEPSGRYASAEELGDELRRFLSGEPILARPPGQLRRLARRARRHPKALLAALLAAAVAGSLAAGYSLRREPRPPASGDPPPAAVDDGKPRPKRIPHGDGYWLEEYLPGGRPFRRTYYDSAGRPALDKEGIHRRVMEFDNKSRFFATTYFDLEDKPFNVPAYGHARFTHGYDEKGRRNEVSWYVVNKAGRFLLERRENASERLVESALFTPDGEPTVNKFGVHRFEFDPDDYGRLTGQRFYGLDGKPTLGLGGRCYSFKRRFDAAGEVAEEVLFGPNLEPRDGPEGYYRAVWTRDADGRLTDFARFAAGDKPLRYRVVVEWTDPELQAHKAGLRAGDEILKVYGSRVSSLPEAQGLIRAGFSSQPKLRLLVRRSGKDIELALPPKGGAGYRLREEPPAQ